MINNIINAARKSWIARHNSFIMFADVCAIRAHRQLSLYLGSVVNQTKP